MEKPTWHERQATARQLATAYGLTHPRHTTEQPYRGVVIYWYRIVPESGRTQYATAWQLNGAWYQTPAVDNLIIAIDTAEATIDAQLASAPAERKFA